MTRDELIAAVSADPEALWTILTLPNVRLAGPWVEASSRKDSMRRVRLSPSGAELAYIGPSEPLYPPHPEDYHDYVNEHDELLSGDEQYDDAVREYEERSKVWKPWTYGLHNDSAFYHRRYVDDPEEAKALVDEALRSKGYRLVNGSNLTLSP